jgi:hypothetical protein
MAMKNRIAGFYAQRPVAEQPTAFQCFVFFSANPLAAAQNAIFQAAYERAIANLAPPRHLRMLGNLN